MKKTQTQQIRAALERGRKITPIDALVNFGCFRLGARIKELRDAGMPVVTTITRRAGKNFATYSMP